MVFCPHFLSYNSRGGDDGDNSEKGEGPMKRRRPGEGGGEEKRKIETKKKKKKWEEEEETCRMPCVSRVISQLILTETLEVS